MGNMCEELRYLLLKEDVLGDAHFQEGQKIKFESKNPELPGIYNATITKVYPYVVAAVTDTDRNVTVDKMDFFAEPISAWFE